MDSTTDASFPRAHRAHRASIVHLYELPADGAHAIEHGSAPLADFARDYRRELGDSLSLEDLTDDTLNAVARYLRAGDVEEQRVAWSALVDPTRSPVPENATAADRLLRRVLRRLFLDPVEARGFIVADPPGDSPVAAVIAREVGAIVFDASGTYTIDTRRVAVDVLKKMQATAACDALGGARRSLEGARPALRGGAAAETEDLLARIDYALHPYFE